MKTIYNGPLTKREIKDNHCLKRACNSYRSQKSRCYDKRNTHYCNYGGIGIKVIYNKREFIGWWLDQCTKNKFIDPTISRIDHNGNYEFINVKIEERSENSRERMIRCGQPKKRSNKKVLLIKDGIHFLSTKSEKDAAFILGKCAASISFLCSGINKKTKEGYELRHY